MKKKKIGEGETVPYSNNESITVYYELDFNGYTIKPGDTIKIKNERGSFKFLQFVHNIEKDVQWIDCMHPASGFFRSFYVDRLKAVIHSKKSRRKKENV
jgi:hypothetical protein